MAQYYNCLLQAHLVTDPNLNRTVYGFSPLGLLHQTGLLGKEGHHEGDLIAEARPATATTAAQPLRYQPSTWLDYDFFAFLQDGQPCWTKTTQREQHYAISVDSETLVKVEYSDGFGRLLQTRTQAEEVLFGDVDFGDSGLPADATQPSAPAVGRRVAAGHVHVVVSAWQVYDNKGRVVEKYEPFFGQDFPFVAGDVAGRGQRVRMYYDPRGQLLRTVNPDGTEQRVLYGKPGSNGLGQLDEFIPTPWETYTYDANDLAPLTHSNQGRANAAHAFTPRSSVINVLGQIVGTTDRLGSTAADGAPHEVTTTYEYDVRGNRIRVVDAMGRESFLHIYDLKPGNDIQLNT